MEGSDVAALKSATDRLSQAAMKIGESMYKADAAAQAANATAEAGTAHGAGAGPQPGAKPDERVVDAEFEEVDEKKKRSA